MAAPPILVIDDDRDALEMMSTILEGDYDVVAAANGVHGLTAARERRPGLIILDLMMPVMDGFRVLYELERDTNLRDIPVLVCSGHPKALAKATAAGAEDCIAKPVELDLLESKVRFLYAAG